MTMKNQKMVRITAPGSVTISCSAPFDFSVTGDDWTQIQKWQQDEDHGRIDKFLAEFVNVQDVADLGELEFYGYDRVTLCEEK
jgi:hypothetical protein